MENKIGIIGIGRMGQIIMKAFCDHCYKVYASDPSPHSQEIIKQQGAILMDSPKAVGEKAEVIVLSLPAPKHVNEVILGNSGLNKIIGKKHIIVDTSTVDPQTSKNAFTQCKKTGASYLDAPILGRPDSFGKWVLPVGGDEKVLEEVKAILTTFAHKVIYVGGPGSGHALKLLNQLMFSAINGITAEMFALVDKIGLSKKEVYEVIAASGAATVSGLFLECGKKIINNDFDPVFSIEMLCKDAGLGIKMANEYGAPPFISTTIQMFNEIAQTQGLGNFDTSAIINVFSNMYKIGGKN